jgi:hypothetical protein
MAEGKEGEAVYLAEGEEKRQDTHLMESGKASTVYLAEGKEREVVYLAKSNEGKSG